MPLRQSRSDPRHDLRLLRLELELGQQAPIAQAAELLDHGDGILACDGGILGLSRQGMPIKKITRTTGHSRKLVRNVQRGLTGDVFRPRQSSLDA